MDNALAKKIGEVLAFERGSAELFDKGRAGLRSFWSNADIDNMIKKVSERASAIENWSTASGIAEAVMAKAGATGNKLTAMRDMYVQDRWDDGVEILEWLGFFEGAAIVHWSLVKGGTEAGGYDDMAKLSGEAYKFHWDLLSKDSELIKTKFKK